MHHADRPLTIYEKGFKFSPKYCPTCRFYRPLRSSHSSKSNVCIQRYDHFCQWLGTDIGLHNHGLFYLMLLSIFLYMVLSLMFAIASLVCSVLIIAQCEFTAPMGTSYLCVTIESQSLSISSQIVIASIVVSAIVLATSSYIMYSIVDLIKYHKMLL